MQKMKLSLQLITKEIICRPLKMGFNGNNVAVVLI